ncbi:MAG TPA: PorP/SprF family type IX secretion system membrane protein [Bacteroidales bacterium]|nr:PorP/SprF family type IX secretion system membrane protein [Bacteroidales bacterium]
MIVRKKFHTENLKKTILLIFCIIPFITKAQLEINTGQITKSIEFFNPAYNGMKDYTSAIVLYRGAFADNQSLVSPNYINDLGYTTTAVNLYHPFLRTKTGLAINVIQEQLGHRENTLANLACDVSIKISNKTFLNFGLSGGVNFWQYNVSNALYYGVLGDIEEYNHAFPHISIGLNYIKRGLQLGGALHYSEPNGLEEIIDNQDYNYMTAYMNGSIQIKFSENFHLKPAAILRYKIGTGEFYFEPGAHMLFFDLCWLGATYRQSYFNSAYSIVTDLKVSKFLRLGYAFENNINSVGFMSKPIHEIRLQFQLPIKHNDQYLSSLTF